MEIGVLLLVENDPDLLDSWCDLFELSGHTVHAYASGQALLADPEALAQGDLLITDYHLTDGNGMDLIRKVRQTRESLPCLVLTGMHEPHVAEAVAAEPEVTLFHKPVSAQVIDDAIQECLCQPRRAG